MQSYFDRSEHLRALPKLRAAYSDRTSWLLAEMCRLAYEKLPAEENETSLISAIITATKSDSPEKELKKLVQSVSRLSSDSPSPVETALAGIDFEFVTGISEKGTEAFIARFKGDGQQSGFRVLAFRGTEPTSFLDIKTDLRANLTTAPGGGRIHTGFLKAYKAVQSQLQKALEADSHLPLYITGHSLGGALAMVATRYLENDMLSATYTYGCPRVADDAFYAKVKAPIYRVINAGDGVPRIPFGFMMSVFLTGLRLIPINGTKPISEWMRRHLCGYTHWGNVIFLSPIKSASRSDTTPIGFSVKSSPGIFWRANIVATRWVSSMGKSLIDDHSMGDYSQKLGDYAEWRNPQQMESIQPPQTPKG